MVSIECIINDDSGKRIGKLASPLPPTSNNMAKLEALDKSILFCMNLGITKVIIQGDSQIILNALRNQDTPNWILNSRLKHVLICLDSFKEIQIYHIF